MGPALKKFNELRIKLKKCNHPANIFSQWISAMTEPQFPVFKTFEDPKTEVLLNGLT